MSGQCNHVGIYFDILQISVIDKKDMSLAERSNHSHSLDRKRYPLSSGGTTENLDSIDVLRSVSLKG